MEMVEELWRDGKSQEAEGWSERGFHESTQGETSWRDALRI
jgi:hypothetical protein